jgi:hypothetical protein
MRECRFVVGFRAASIKDVVGRDGQKMSSQTFADSREFSHRHGIDALRRRGFRLRAVDGGVGGQIHHDVGS